MKILKLLLFFCSLISLSCTKNIKHELKSSNKVSHINTEKTLIDNVIVIDSLEQFFHSKGVLVFEAKDENLSKDILLLNGDNSVYLKLNLLKNTIKIDNIQFRLDEFNNLLKTGKSIFHPKEFYTDNYIIQFEYIKINNGFAEVYINKEKNIKKFIRLGGNLFRTENWKKHLIGCVIDFNVKDNFIRKANSDNSPSIGYEYSEESVTFSINEIKGDWIKIECVDFCDTPCKFEEEYNGWIKWKKGNDLLIRLLYAC